MATRRYDVLILGGGAAGLMAARVLKQRGKRALVIEGRGRLGGRMWTDSESVREPLPLELGAEFVHGPAPVTERLAREHGLTMVEVPERHFKREHGRWIQNGGMWERLGRVFSGIPEKEQSFASFARRLPPREARETLRFVEGFHGADTEDISAPSLKQTPEEFEEAGRMRRVLGGYAQLVHALEGVPALLGARVDAVAWRRGEARVIVQAPGGRQEFLAPRAIVTLPLGVLQAGLVRFSPSLDEKEEALNALAMGHALRVGLRFEEPFWEKRAPSGAFWHLEDGAFPVWWGSPLPGRPALTAWSGGPRALENAAHGTGRAVGAALSQLARVTGAGEEEIFRALSASRAHDFSHDVFSFGAYSYARTSAQGAFEQLARPLAGTLFFAGEHTICGGENGTVEGALRSGETAARACR